MGLFDKLVNTISNYDYEGAIDRKVSSFEKRGRDEIRQKARHATDEELRHNLERAIDNGNYIMEDEIRREMDRRGMYY